MRDCSHTHEVEHVDTDASGIVHFSRYASLFETACLKFLKELGHSIEMLNENGYDLVIREIKIKYLISAQYGDLLNLVCEIMHHGAARIILNTKSFRDSDGILIAEGQLDFVCVSLTDRKPVQFPKDFKTDKNYGKEKFPRV